MNFASIVGENQLNSERNQNSKLALKTKKKSKEQKHKFTHNSQNLVAELTIFSTLVITT